MQSQSRYFRPLGKALLRLSILLPASRINKDDLEAEFQKEVKRVQATTVDTEKQEDLKTQMDGFLKVRYGPHCPDGYTTES